MKVLAVVPARGGSKRIPLKNIAPLAGKPLLAYTLEAIRDAGLFDNAVVSTDDAKIAGVAADFGSLAEILYPQRRCFWMQ